MMRPANLLLRGKQKKDEVAAHTTKLMKECKGNNAKCSTVK